MSQPHSKSTVSLVDGPGNEATTCLWIHCQSRDDALERRRNARDASLPSSEQLMRSEQRSALVICVTAKLQGRKRKGNIIERENNTAAYIAMHRKKIILV